MNIQKFKKRTETKIAESTMNTRISGIKNLQGFLDHNDEPSPEDVEDWVDHLIDKHAEGNISSGTIDVYFKAVCYYFRAVHGDDRDIQHLSRVLPTKEVDHGDYLQPEEWEKLRSYALNRRLRAFVDLMYYYARRPAEVRLLNWEDVDFGEGTITFNIVKKKENLRATFNLKKEVEDSLKAYKDFSINQTETLEEYVDQINGNIDEPELIWSEEVTPIFTTSHGRISQDTIWRNIKNLADKAGIDKNVTPKTMRHTRTTHLDWEGHSPEEIARHQLVHEPDSNVVGGYIHDRPETEVRETMELDDEQS
jgi:integrase